MFAFSFLPPANVALPFAQHWLAGGEKPTLGAFYLRRLTRLEPPYFFNLIAMWLIGALVGGWTLGAAIPGLLASLVYQHNQVFGYHSAINPATWSLEVEFQFYLLAPLLTLVFAPRNMRTRWALIGATVLAVSIFRYPSAERVSLSLVGSIEYFAARFIAVDFYLVRWKGRLPGLIGWDIAAVAGWLGFLSLTRLAHLHLHQPLQAICLAVAILGSMGGAMFGRLFGNIWVCTFGGMCYTFYLWHQVIMLRISPFLDGASWMPPSYTLRLLVIGGIMMPVILVVCTALFIWVEKPFMQRDWPSKLRHWLRGTLKR